MSKHRLDVKQAAEVLGISSEGVRKRIKRGTLESEKAQDGKVFVWLDRSNGSDAGLHANGDPGRTEYGQGADTRSDALQSSLRDQVSYLRNQLDLEREANRENRRLLAAALERIPEIEPPRPANSKATPDPRDVPETASEDTGGDEGPPEPQEPTQRRSWLHRFFGFE
jgi:hypothetical protein